MTPKHMFDVVGVEVFNSSPVQLVDFVKEFEKRVVAEEHPTSVSKATTQMKSFKFLICTNCRITTSSAWDEKLGWLEKSKLA